MRKPDTRNALGRTHGANRPTKGPTFVSATKDPDVFAGDVATVEGTSGISGFFVSGTRDPDGFASDVAAGEGSSGIVGILVSFPDCFGVVVAAEEASSFIVGTLFETCFARDPPFLPFCFLTGSGGGVYLEFGHRALLLDRLCLSPSIMFSLPTSPVVGWSVTSELSCCSEDTPWDACENVNSHC